MSKLCILLPLFFLIPQNTANLSNKLNVAVLYESLCPDSLSFITEQLYPVWRDLAPYININLIPFGKSASLENGLEFMCQHGPQECKGNRIQSCALSAIQDQNLQVEYVNCFMKVFRKNQRNPNELGVQCTDLVGLNFQTVEDCYNSNKGTELQLEAERETLKIRPRFVPTILYNGVFNQQLQDDSIADFRTVACHFITQVHSEACQQFSVLRL